MTSDRRYDFPIGAADLWDAITRVDDYRAWWPWLRGLDAAAFDAGETWTCVVQPPMPYVLRFRISLDEVDAPARVTARVTGDIVGTARLELTEHDGGCEARLLSRLAPNSRLLQAVGRVARPLVQYGHDWVLDTGARQFSSRALT